MTTAEIIARAGSLGFDVSTVNGAPWLCERVSAGNDDIGLWDRYTEIQETLAAHGLRIFDAHLEHDCISGYLQETTR